MPSKTLPPSMHVGEVTLTARATLPVGLPIVGDGALVEVSYLGERYPAKVVRTDGRTSEVAFEVTESDLFAFAIAQVRR